MKNKKHTNNRLFCGGKFRLLGSLLILMLLSTSIFAQSSITAAGTNFKHDDDKGQVNSLLRVSDTMAILAYSGYKNKGYVRTFSMTADGKTTAQLAELEFDGDDAYGISIAQLNSDIFVIAYRGRSEDGFITTIKVSADGKTITQVKKFEHDTKDGFANSLVKVDDNTVALLYKGDESGASSIIKTFDIPADGSTITQVATLKLNIAGSHHKIIPIGGDKYVTIMEKGGASQVITTASISADGKTISQIKQITESGAGRWGDIVKMDGDTYALVSNGSNKKGTLGNTGNGAFIATYDIPADGSTITKVSALRFTTNNNIKSYYSLVKVADVHYALAFFDSGGGKIKTFYMTEDGKLISQVDEKTFYTNNTSYNSFVKMDSETYMLAFTDASNKGVLYTADIRSDLPFFKTVALAPDNSTITVTFNEPVYNTSGGSGNIIASDFLMLLSGGHATLSSSTPSSIAVSGNTYTLGIPIDGSGKKPKGDETVLINPQNKIYDADGNEVVNNQNYYDTTPSGTTQRNKVTLYDQFLPYITASSNEMPSDNSYIEVTFNEAVFTNNNGSGDLVKDDFVLSISGGTGTLSSGTPSSITKSSNTYKIYFTLATITDGQETLKVDLASNAVFDAAGNAAEATQANNTGQLNDGRLKTVTSKSMYNSTSTYFRTIKDSRTGEFLTYFSRGGRGYLYKNTFNEDGSGFNALANTQISPNVYTGFTSMIKGPGDLYITADAGHEYETGQWGGAIRTVAIIPGTKAPVIIDNARLNKNFSSSTTWGKFNDLVALNDSTYLVAYHGKDYDGYISSFRIKLDGQITPLFDLEHDTRESYFNKLVKVDSNTVALAYEGYGNNNNKGGYIKTFTVTPKGDKITQDAYSKFTPGGCGNCEIDFARLNEDIYVIAYRGDGADGFIETYSISKDGTTITAIKELEHDKTQGTQPSLLKIGPNTVLLAYSGYGDDGYLKSFEIASDGSTITENISFEHDRNQAKYSDLFQIDSDTYGLNYFNSSGYAWVKTFNNLVATAANMKPEISTVSLSSDNSTIAVKFNEPVYTATGATTALVVNDFALSITGGTATLSSATPSSISISGNTYTLGLPLSGTPNGNEILTVSPSSDSEIYDASNNAASATQMRNTVYLYDKTPPKIVKTSVKYNETVNVTFDEPVFGSNSMAVTQVSDFAFAISGGTATLSSNTPSSISTQNNGKNGTGYNGSETRGPIYALGMSISGTANGKEKISVSPAANSIYDIAGNVASSTQAGGVDSLSKESILPAGTLEFNTSEARDASVVHLHDSLYVVAYAGLSGDGFLQTFTVSADGKRVAKISEIEHDQSDGWNNSLVKADDNTVVLAYRGQSGDGFIKTFDISADGKTFTQLYDLEHNSSGAYYNSLIKVDSDTYALAYQENTGWGYARLSTFTIPPDGKSIKEEKQVTIAGNRRYSHQNSLVNGEPGIIIHASGGYSSWGAHIHTYSISENGKNISLIAKKLIDTQPSSEGYFSSLMKMDEDTYIHAIRSYSPRVGTIKTLTISKDGKTITVEDNQNMEFAEPKSGNSGDYNSLLKINSNNFALASRDRHNDGWVFIYELADDGKSIKNNWRYEFEPITMRAGVESALFPVNGSTIGIAWSTHDYDGIIKTLALETIDNVKPKILSSSLSFDNQFVTIELNEPAYKANTGIGALEKLDFTFSLAGGTASLSSTAPTSINQYGGRNGIFYQLGLGLNGIPDGTEVVTVSFASNSVYDGLGNVGDATQSNNTGTLNEKTLPKIIASTISGDNKTITVTFSEPVYNSTNGSGGLAKEDFALSLSTGSATLQNSTPSSITSSGNTYTLIVAYSGIADGTEVLTVKPANLSIYDKVGNVASTTQTNNQLSLNEVKILEIATAEHNTSNGTWNSLVKVDDDTYALAYSGSSNDGYIQTFAIAADGLTITKPRSPLEHDYSYNVTNSFIKVDDNTFALAYAGPGNDGYIKTFEINATGSSISQTNVKEHDKSEGRWPSLIHLNGTTYLLAYQGPQSDGYIKTFTITNDGSSIVELDKLEHDTNQGNHNALHKMSDSTAVLVYANPNMQISTFKVSTDGKTITEITSKEIWNGTSQWNSIAQVDSNTYVVSTQGLDEDGYLYTFDIPKDGSTITQVSSLEQEETKYESGSLVATGSNTYVLAYRGSGMPGMIKMFGIGGNGKNIKQLYSTKHRNTNGHNSLAKVDSDTYALAHHGPSNDGYIKSFTVKASDNIVPKIAYITVNSNNTSVDVTFTEPVYSSAYASGAIEAADFALSIAGGTATLQSTEPTSITASGNTFTLGFTIVGTPDGDEVLKVLPVTNSIYDGGGNAASTSQSTNNTKNLYDKAGPKFTKTVIAADNKSVEVTFDEDVFSTSTSSGNLDKDDFNLTIAGGSAKISSATPLTLSASGKTFKLTFTITGSPDGNEVLTILPVESSIYDTYGNASSKIQSNNSANLADIVPPVIDSVSISSDNDLLEIAFNEDVFGKNDGASKLDTSDFVYSLTGGSAKLSKNYPSSVGTGTGKKITLGVLLNGLPDGSEIITVLPADSAVYDKKGNIAKTTQSNNQTNLNDKVVPYFKTTSISPSNSEVNITFSEEVFAKSNGTGALDSADFVFTLTGGTAKLLKTYPDSITSTGNTYNLKLNLDGIPDGSETLVFSPKENAVFDSSGNPASTSQSNNSLKLYDKAPPIISDLTLKADNSTLSITFNEAVYSKGDGTGDLEKSDFVFAIVGGAATLTTPFATSISKSGNTYTVGLGIKGEPTGKELLTVLIVDKAVFDAAGNAAVIEQAKSKIQLNDKNAPIISALELAADNATLKVSFNENIFSSFDGTGDLDSTAFILTLNEGTAKLSQKHPSKITMIDTSNVFSLDLPLTGMADGDEMLTITLQKEGIYDESGTEAAETQIKNKVPLYDLSAPMFTEIILDSDNKHAFVRFSVPVFATAKATGALEADDFKLSLAGGSATLQNITPSSIDSSDNGTRYKLGIDLLGIPDGSEVLTINPVDNNIFDDAANSANKVQIISSVNLFDKQPPTITGSKISNTNDTLTVTFSEPIFSNNDSTGTLENEDFIMALAGGLAGLSSATPSSVTAAATGNTYHLVFAITGTPDGYEELTVLPGTNSIFDAAGNAAEGFQENNLVYLNDLKPPLAPTGLTGIAGNEKVTLFWTANPEKDISKYYVYGGTDPIPTSKIDSVNFGKNTTMITGLTNKTTYYYRISAFDRTGLESEKSDTISVTPDQKRAFTVKEDGSGDYTDIQGAIDAAASGDTVYISGGTFDSIRVDSKSIEIIAGSGPGSSFIDSKGKTTAVILSGFPNQTAISGFTIRGGVGDNNADGMGGGIRVEAGVSAKIDNCIITGNEDGAIFFGDSSKSEVTNTLVYGNDKALIFGSGIADLINCTFIEEKENSLITDGATVNFINTIFMDQFTATDTSKNISVWANYSLFKYGDNAFNSNQIKSFNWGSTNIKTDPLFVDTLNADYHLTKDSPAIGVGAASFTLNNLTYKAPAKDIDGYNRPSPNGSAPDLGVYESPYSNSSPKANFISDGDTDSLEIDFSTSTSTLSAHWKPFASTTSIYYEYAIGIDPKLNDVVDWTIIGFDTFKVVNDLELKNSTKYLFSVRGKNEQGESASVTTDGVFIDWEKPVIQSVTEWKTDLDWFGPNTPGVAVVNATDNGGIAKYEFSVGITQGDTSLVGWTPSDSSVALLDVSALSENTQYYTNARVTDFVGFMASGSSNGFKMDVTPPTAGTVSIGDQYQADTSQVKFVVDDFSDDDSGIGKYEFSLGSTPDGQDIIPRKPAGMDPNFTGFSFNLGGLSLQENETYYGTIYALDKVGNESLRVSEGLTIDRTGPEDGIVADGSGEDTDYSNDTLNISVNWYGFRDMNGVDKYEVALDTINTATDSTVWVNVGKDSSYTFTDLKLNLNQKYYTLVQAYDKLGNASNVISSDGFIIDLVGPKVATVSPSTSKLVSVFGKLEVDLEMSEEIASANIEYASTQGDILNIDPTFTVDKTNIKISFKPPFTSGDQVRILVQTTDLAGNTSPTKELLYTIAYLGDYDFADGIDWKDLNIFVKAFDTNDLSKELGPVTRSAPHFRPAPDSLFNTRDAMAFVRMWNWDKNKNSGKLMAKVLPTEGIKLNAEFEADHMMIYPPKGTKAMEVILNYPVMDMSMGMPIKEAVTDEAITLSRVDTVAGQILLNTAYFVKNDLPIRIDLNHLQRDNKVPVDISYQFIDDNNQILSSGSEVLEIRPIPTEFALHNNFPNPFNPVTTINYDIPKEGRVSLIVYDLMGREVTRLTDNFMPAGYHTVRWNARNQFGMEVSAGVYFYHIQAGEFVKTQKMILLK